MSIQTINVGAAPNDGLGDPLRTAFEKTNDNFVELYADVAGLESTKASVASPSLTGTPLAPTASAATNTTQIATTAFVVGEVAVESAARVSADALKADLASPTFTGIPAAPTAALGTNTTQLATAAFVYAEAARLQRGFGRTRMQFTEPLGNSATTVSSFGHAVTVTGTATARALADTNTFTRLSRLAYVSAATAGATAGARSSAALCIARSGYVFNCIFGVSDAATVANSRLAVGLFSSGSVIGNVEPSTLLNCVFIGADAGESTLSIMHNDGSGAATKVALGANAPAQTLSVDAYYVRFTVPSGAATIDYYVERLGTAFTFSGTLSTNLPVATTTPFSQIWRNNGATALAVGIDYALIFAEVNF